METFYEIDNVVQRKSFDFAVRVVNTHRYICGLVQVPCIERNAFAAARALDSSTFSILSDGRHLVSFDKIVRTMNQTGHDLPSIYKETSAGGLALDL